MEYVWLILFVIFLIAEIFLLSIFSLFLSFGGLVTFLLVQLKVLDITNWASQILIFSLFSLLSFFLFRNYLRRILRGSPEKLKDEFVGQQVICKTMFSKENSYLGKVEFNGSLWQAQSEEEFNIGDVAFVQQRDNVTLKIIKNN